MDSDLSFIEGLVARLEGPMSLRFVMQPLVALFFAFRDGRKDAREGRSPYLWALFTEPEHRLDILQRAWTSIGKVFIIATVLDFVFQYIVFHDFRPVGALLAGLILAILPYLLLRGPEPPSSSAGDAQCLKRPIRGKGIYISCKGRLPSPRAPKGALGRE
jgi:hypothetical protein